MDVTKSRLLMIRTLKSNVVPSIKKLGFSGNFPHFRKKKSDRFEFISFQFSRYGGKFVAECGFTKVSDLLPFEKEAGFEKLNHGNARSRLRIGAVGVNEEYWFEYEKFENEAQFEKLAQSINRLLPQAEMFLK